MSPKVTGNPDTQKIIEKSILNPIGSEPLKNLVNSKSRIAFLVSDITRPCPTNIILPVIIRKLKKYGVNENKMTIIFATGAHRPHTREEKIKLVGQKIASKIKLIDHNCKDKNNLEYIGKTSRGTIIELNKLALNHDLIIGIANIDIHWFAGYSGGCKSILPGISSYETIIMNHKLMLKPGAEPGKIINNPVREDIDEIANIIEKFKFIVNVVLNDKKEIVKTVAGHPIKAHRAGIPIVDEMFKVKVKEKADIVIASAGGFPKDINLYQAQKALDNASRIVKKNGVIILVAECRDGLGGENTPFKQWLKEASKPEEIIEKIKNEWILGGHKAYGIARIAIKNKIILVSKLSEEKVKMAFMQPAKNIKEAIIKAYNHVGKDASIIVMPYAGSTLPITNNH